MTLGSLFAIFEPWIWRRLGPVPACSKFQAHFTLEEFTQYSLTSVLHTSLGENAQVRYSEVCVISEKDQMMKTKHGGTKYVRYSEGYTIVHVCDTEVKL